MELSSDERKTMIDSSIITRNYKTYLKDFEKNYNKVQPIFELLGFELKKENDRIIAYTLDGLSLGPMNFLDRAMIYHCCLFIETEKGELAYRIENYDIRDWNKHRNTIWLSNLKMVVPEEDIKKGFTKTGINIRAYVDEKVAGLGTIAVYIKHSAIEDISTELFCSQGRMSVDFTRSFADNYNTPNMNRQIYYKNIDKHLDGYRNYFESLELGSEERGHFIFVAKNDEDEPTLDDFRIEAGNFTKYLSPYTRIPGNEFKQYVDRLSAEEIVTQLMAAPRTKNLVEYVLSSIKHTIPGLCEYIFHNYSIMTKVDDIMNGTYSYSNEKEIDKLLAANRMQELDLPGEKENNIVLSLKK